MTLPMDILRSAGIDEVVLAKIQTMLDTDSDRLKQTRPAHHSEDRFGRSATGVELNTHASTAHQHVREALDEMVAGLRGYYLGVRDFGQHVVEADDVTTADLNRVLTRTEQASRRAGGDDFHNPGRPPATPPPTAGTPGAGSDAGTDGADDGSGA